MVGADAVVHTAAETAVTSSLSDPIKDFEVNALGTLNVLEAISDVSKAKRQLTWEPEVSPEEARLAGTIQCTPVCRWRLITLIGRLNRSEAGAGKWLR